MDIKIRRKHRYNTISIFRSIFFPRNYTVILLICFLLAKLNIFRTTEKIFAIFFAPCRVIDSGQKKFAVNMQLRR